MADITTGLPTPDLADNGIIDTDTDPIVKNYYNVLDVGGSFAVARTLDQFAVITSVNGDIRLYANQCSAAFETNSYVKDGTCHLLGKDGTDQIYIESISLTTNEQLSKKFITIDEGGFASLAVDITRNELIIYKHFIPAGQAGHSFIYAYNMGTFVLDAKHDAQGVVPADAFLHIFVDDTGAYYRSYKSGATAAIQAMTQTVLDDQFYAVSPSAGTTNIQDVSADFLYYPTFANDKVYVFNEAMTEITAYDSTTPNTQVITPTITVDTRTNLFHLDNGAKVGYNRLLFDISTDIIHDTRTFFSHNESTNSLVSDRYPICIDNNINTDYTITTSDRQPVRVFSRDSTRAFYRVNDTNYVFILNSAAFCPIVQPLDSEKSHIIPGPRLRPFLELQDHVGEVDSNEIVGRPVYLDDTYTVVRTGSTIVVDGGTSIAQGLSGDVYRQSQFEFEGNYYVRDASNFFRFTTSSVSSFPANALATEARYGFIYNEKMFVANDTQLSIFDTNTDAVLDFNIAFSRPNRVRLFPNPFTNELYLFDKDALEIWVLNFEPRDFDYTIVFEYQSRGTLLYSGIPDTNGLSDTTVEWEMSVITPDEIVYFDYINGKYQGLFRGFGVNSRVGLVTPQTALWVPGSNIQHNGYFTFNKSIQEAISTTGAIQIPTTDFITENFDYSNPPVINTTQAPVVWVSPDGWMRWLFNGVSGSSGNNSQLIDFKRRSIRKIDTVLDNDKLRFIFESGETSFRFEVDECDIDKGEYRPLMPIPLKRTIFNDGHSVSTPEAKEVLKRWSLTLVADSDLLSNFLSLFHHQWYYAAENKTWEILFDDTIYPENSNIQTFRPTILVDGDNEFVRHSIAITKVDWSWYACEQWLLTLEFQEIEIIDDDIYFTL